MDADGVVLGLIMRAVALGRVRGLPEMVDDRCACDAGAGRR
jgi:hypothetical protein